MMPETKKLRLGSVRIGKLCGPYAFSYDLFGFRKSEILFCCLINVVEFLECLFNLGFEVIIASLFCEFQGRLKI